VFDVKKHIAKKGLVFRFTCPLCEKTIESLYENQVEHNAHAHMVTHNGTEKSLAGTN